MSHDDHKEMSRHALGMWGSDNTCRAKDIFATNYINHQEPDVEGGVSSKSLEEWKKLVSDYHNSFSDSHVKILMQVAEGDKVATRWEFTSTHTGEFMGHAPNGKRVTWTGVQIDRFEDGKIVESWVYWDKYRFLDEFGLLK